jgi:hypothetical protein
MDELKYEYEMSTELFWKLYVKPAMEAALARGAKEFDEKYCVKVDAEGNIIPHVQQKRSPI